MIEIDLATWPRHSQYTFFRQIERPHFSLTVAVDATGLKRSGRPVFNGALHAIMSAANAVPELRTRFRDDTVVLHDVVHPSVTVPIGDDEFAFCEVEFSPEWSVFQARCEAAIVAARTQTELVDQVAHLDDWIYLSCLPWVNFTAMSNPLNGPDDCIPRIAWGRLTETADGWTMPVALEAHHALVDGLHAARFFKALEANLAEIGGQAGK